LNDRMLERFTNSDLHLNSFDAVKEVFPGYRILPADFFNGKIVIVDRFAFKIHFIASGMGVLIDTIHIKRMVEIIENKGISYFS